MTSEIKCFELFRMGECKRCKPFGSIDKQCRLCYVSIINSDISHCCKCRTISYVGELLYRRKAGEKCIDPENCTYHISIGDIVRECIYCKRHINNKKEMCCFCNRIYSYENSLKKYSER